jgi:hypothetical protein
MQALLTWTPVTNISQDIQYRTITGVTTWNLFSSVGPSVNTATITGLLVNRIYEFRIVNNCSNSGVAYSNLDSDINLTCPSVDYVLGTTLVFYSFTHLGGDVNKYEVLLYATDGTTLLSTNIHTNPSGTIDGSFTTVANTNYKVEVRVYAGNATGIYTYSKICTQDSITTLVSDPVVAYIDMYGQTDGIGNLIFTASVTSGTTLDNLTFTGEIMRYIGISCTAETSECPFTNITLLAGNSTQSSGTLCALNDAVTLKVVTATASGNSITTSPQLITVNGNDYIISGFNVCTGL